MFRGEERYSQDMAFGPDIIVTDPDTSQITLVVEAKTCLHDPESAELQLKRYMTGTLCPVGLIAKPQQLRLYRNQYASSPEDSIELVGTFEIDDLLDFGHSGPGGGDASEFERRVQAWLEGLGSEAGLQNLPAELRRAVKWYILPAVTQGVVQAAHPRPPTSLRAYST
jgi:hypothetical protein